MRRLRSVIVLVVGIAGLGAVAVAGLAIAKSFTLRVASNAPVTNFVTKAVKHENIVVNGRGFAVYTLTGNNLKNCTNKVTMKGLPACFNIWPPLTVSSATSKISAAPGIKGKLGIIHRNGIFQVTLGGHPLYMFSFDKTKNTAGGEGVVSFGGTWHVVKPDPAKSGLVTTTTTTGTTTTMTTTTTTTTYTY